MNIHSSNKELVKHTTCANLELLENLQLIVTYHESWHMLFLGLLLSIFPSLIDLSLFQIL